MHSLKKSNELVIGKFPTFKDLGAEVFNLFIALFLIIVFLKKFKHSNVIETCSKKGIPVIKREDLKDLKPISFGPRYYGVVCQAQWTRPDGVKVCGSSTNR